jgi:uncharacterized protein (TIGR02271 family)
MNTMNQHQFRAGDTVLANDGENLGKLYAVEDGLLHVEKGWLFPKDYQVPVEVIERYDPDNQTIYLSVTKDEALNSGWTQRDTPYVSGSDAVYATDGNVSTIDSGAVMDAGEYDSTVMTDTTLAETGYAAGSETIDDDRIVVPVHEEELTATTRERAAGDVRVTKRVIEEDQTLDVPVTEERVSVTRRTVDRDATTGEDVFTEETIDVPLRAEEVDLQKRTRVAEEIEIDKERVQRTERVGGTVRREEVDVEDSTAFMNEADRGTGATQ